MLRGSDLLRRWERLPPAVQGALAFPALAALTFFLNVGPFAQPLGRSLLYALFEGGLLTALLLVATRAERDRRG